MATTTFNTTAAEDVRISAAFGQFYNVPNATQAQVRQQVIQWITGVVQAYEQNKASASAVAAVVPIAPT